MTLISERTAVSVLDSFSPLCFGIKKSAKAYRRAHSVERVVSNDEAPGLKPGFSCVAAPGFLPRTFGAQRASAAPSRCSDELSEGSLHTRGCEDCARQWLF